MIFAIVSFPDRERTFEHLESGPRRDGAIVLGGTVTISSEQNAGSYIYTQAKPEDSPSTGNRW